MIIGELRIPLRPAPVDYLEIITSHNAIYDDIKDVWEPDAYFRYCKTNGKICWIKEPLSPIGTYHGHYKECPPDYVVTDYCIHDSTQKLDYITVGVKDPWDIDADYQYAFKRSQLFIIPEKRSLETMLLPKEQNAWDYIKLSTFFEYCKEHNLPVYYSPGDFDTYFEFLPNGVPYPDELIDKLHYISVADKHGVHHLFRYEELNWSLSSLCENHPLNGFHDLDREGIRKVLQDQLALPYCEPQHLQVFKDDNRYTLIRGWFTHQGQHRQFEFFRTGYSIPLRLEPDFLSATFDDTPIGFTENGIKVNVNNTDLSQLHLKESIKVENYVILSDTDTGSKWKEADYKFLNKFKNVPCYTLFSKDYPQGIEVYDSTLTYELKEDKRRQRAKLGLQGIKLPKGRWSDAEYIKYAQMHQRAEQGEYLEIQRTNPNIQAYLLNRESFGWVNFIKPCTTFTDFIDFIKQLGIGEVVCNIVFVKSEFATLKGFLENYSQLPDDSRTRAFLSLIVKAFVAADMKKIHSQLLCEV